MRRLLPLLLLAACNSPSSPQTPKYDDGGSFAIGQHTFTFVDKSRATPANGSYMGAPDRTLVVELWYPTSGMPSPGEETMKDAPPAPGTYPLVVHSHGFMDSRLGEAYLARHLAAHGFVVEAPDYPLSNGAAPGGPTVLDVPNQPGDISFIIDQLLADPTYGAMVDAKKIGVSGLSLGGLTTLLAAFHPRLRDARIQAALPIAPVSCMFTQAFFAQALPVLFLQGDADLLAPPEDNSERSFPLAQMPKELVLLKNGSHTGFSGFASLFDPTMNYDRLGCQVLGNVAVTSFSGLGTAAEGINQDANACPAPCQGTPVDPSLLADRQQELTRIIGLAFFDAWLRGDMQAKSFLQKALAGENPEVTARLQ